MDRPTLFGLLVPAALVSDHLDIIPSSVTIGPYAVLIMGAVVLPAWWGRLRVDRLPEGAGWGLGRDGEGLHLWAGKRHVMWCRDRSVDAVEGPGRGS